jgi:hypothetical protein
VAAIVRESCGLAGDAPGQQGTVGREMEEGKARDERRIK